MRLATLPAIASARSNRYNGTCSNRAPTYCCSSNVEHVAISFTQGASILETVCSKLDTAGVKHQVGCLRCSIRTGLGCPCHCSARGLVWATKGTGSGCFPGCWEGGFGVRRRFVQM